MPMRQNLSRMTAEEAESLIFNGGDGGRGRPRTRRRARPCRGLSRLGRVLHRAGTAIGHRLLEGASTGTACDDESGPGRGRELAGPLHDLGTDARTGQRREARIRGHAPLS